MTCARFTLKQGKEQFVNIGHDLLKWEDIRKEIICSVYGHFV